MTPASRAVLCVALGAVAALAQTVISAKSGTIHYVEGRAYLDNQAVENKFGHFPEMKENTVLSTDEGRVEVLLTPGVFLRLGENSAIHMVTNRLVDTRLEFTSGSAVLEADEILKDNSVTVAYRDVSVHLAKKGLYRFDANPPALRVFDGEATVTAGDRTVEVKEGKRLSLDSELAATKFDKEATDALDRWSRRRGEYVAMANLSAANRLRTSGQGWASSGWFWNPYFSMFTFVPGNGAYMSPYGWRFYSPLAVYQVYQPRPVYSGGAFARGGGFPTQSYPTMSHTSSGYSGVVAAAPVSAPAAHAPSSTAAAAPSAPVASSGSSAGHSGGAGSRR